MHPPHHFPEDWAAWRVFVLWDVFRGGLYQKFFDLQPGAVYRARLDSLDWLASGYSDHHLPVLIYSNRLYREPEGPPSSSKRVVAQLVDDAPTRLAGFAWPEADERLPGSVFLYEQRIGQGRIIAFAEDPAFRGYWRGVDRLFLNAVVLGPSAP